MVRAGGTAGTGERLNSHYAVIHTRGLTGNLMCQQILPELGGATNSAIHHHRLLLIVSENSATRLERGDSAFPPLAACLSRAPEKRHEGRRSEFGFTPNAIQNLQQACESGKLKL